MIHSIHGRSCPREVFEQKLQSENRNVVDVATAMLKIIDLIDSRSGDSKLFASLSHFNLVFYATEADDSEPTAVIAWSCRKNAYRIALPYDSTEWPWRDAEVETYVSCGEKVVDSLVLAGVIPDDQVVRITSPQSLSTLRQRYREVQIATDESTGELCERMILLLNALEVAVGSQILVISARRLWTPIVSPSDLSIQIHDHASTGCEILAEITPTGFEMFSVSMPAGKDSPWPDSRIKSMAADLDDVIFGLRQNHVIIAPP